MCAIGRVYCLYRPPQVQCHSATFISHTTALLQPTQQTSTRECCRYLLSWPRFPLPLTIQLHLPCLSAVMLTLSHARLPDILEQTRSGLLVNSPPGPVQWISDSLTTPCVYNLGDFTAVSSQTQQDASPPFDINVLVHFAATLSTCQQSSSPPSPPLSRQCVTLSRCRLSFLLGCRLTQHTSLIYILLR